MNKVEELLDGISYPLDRLEQDEWSQIQGLILNDYGPEYKKMEHQLCSIVDTSKFRKFLRSQVHQVVFGSCFEENYQRAMPRFNLSFAYRGLMKMFRGWLDKDSLDVKKEDGNEKGPEEELVEDYFKASFPQYQEGLKNRAETYLGDDLSDWEKVYSEEEVDVILTTFKTGQGKDYTDPDFENWGLELLASESCEKLEGDKEHFGFRDGISQPWLNGGPKPTFSTPLDRVMPWTLVLRERYEAMYNLDIEKSLKEDLPQSLVAMVKCLMEYGSFAAFRKMRQDVHAFQDYLTQAASVSGKSTDWLGAHMVGRWANGTPLAQSQDHPLQAYDFVDDYLEDDKPVPPEFENQIEKINDFQFEVNGSDCPFGAHIRRTNPRNSIVAGRSDIRRLVRRAMPYGPVFDAMLPNSHKQDRGLMGFFICGDLRAQFEHIYEEWMNKGRFTGLPLQEKDPITGNNARVSEISNGDDGGEFSIQSDTKPTMLLSDLPRFVLPVGGVYVFFPGLKGLQLLAGLDIFNQGQKTVENVLKGSTQKTTVKEKKTPSKPERPPGKKSPAASRSKPPANGGKQKGSADNLEGETS